MSASEESPYDVRLEDVSIPNRVLPSTNVQVQARVRNRETNIPGPLVGDEPSRCDNPRLPGKEGLKVRVAVISGGNRVAERAQCVGVLGGYRDYSLNWPTPSSGTREVIVRAEHADDGTLIAERATTVEIADDAPEQPVDGPIGGDGDSSIGVLNWAANNPEQVIVAVIVIVLLVLLAPYIVALLNYSASTA